MRDVENQIVTAATYADGLRRIADFIEANPDFKLPGDIITFHYTREEFLAAVKILAHGGVVEKKSTDLYYHAIRKFGAVAIDMHIDRSTICRLITPAVYECPDSLLEASAEYAGGATA